MFRAMSTAESMKEICRIDTATGLNARYRRLRRDIDQLPVIGTKRPPLSSARIHRKGDNGKSGHSRSRAKRVRWRRGSRTLMELETVAAPLLGRREVRAQEGRLGDTRVRNAGRRREARQGAVVAIGRCVRHFARHNRAQHTDDVRLGAISFSDARRKHSQAKDHGESSDGPPNPHFLPRTQSRERRLIARAELDGPRLFDVQDASTLLAHCFGRGMHRERPH
jgi:hypothetical protein